MAHKIFLIMIKTQFGAIVKTIRSENETEFFNSKFLNLFTTLGILHQSSCSHPPQQNSVEERKHRQILNISRAIIFQSHIPIKFWGILIQTVVYLMNRLSSSSFGGRSPYEIIFSKVLFLVNLRVVGCFCYASVLPKGDKFSKRVRPTVLMGYSTS